MSEHEQSGGGGVSDKQPLTRMYFLQAVTPLHAGVGQGVSAINLPTARERVTEYPYLPGSSVKGVLRECAEVRYGGDKAEDVVVAFGPPSENAADARGGLVLTDASLLLLPVRSLFGTFAWVTCPFVLRRFARDAKEAGFVPPAPMMLNGESALLPKETCLISPATGGLFLEELQLKAQKNDSEATAWANWLAEKLYPNDTSEQAFFKQRFVLVHDDIFSSYTKLSLEVRHRVKIDDARGTAAKSGPWTEEHLPTETLLYGLAITRPTAFVKRGKNDRNEPTEEKPAARLPKDSGKVLDELLKDRPVLRFGGHASIGLGRARIALM